MKKKWSLIFISCAVIVFLLTAALMFIFDPYFHFHKPVKRVSYTVDNYVYQNDGISKHWDYDAILTGTSMTKDFSEEQINECFGVNCVRLTFLGEGYRRINDNEKTVLKSNKDIKLVIRALDPMWFISSKDYLEYGTYDNYPTYLYDDDWKNDFQYVFNYSIIKNELVPEIVRTAKGTPPVVHDDDIVRVKGDRERLKRTVVRGEKNPVQLTPEEDKKKMEDLAENIEANLISTIRENPNTRFIIFFPPYGLFFWDGIVSSGPEIFNERRNMERYVIEELLKYDNVELYSFLDDFEVTTDLNNYIDESHYDYKTCEHIIECMAKTGEHRLTKDNYEDYLKRTYEFYENYDYDTALKGF